MSSDQNRKIKNFLLQPKVQFRYIFLFFSTGVLCVGLVQGALLRSFGMLLMEYGKELNLGKDIMTELERNVSNTWLVSASALAVMWIGSLVLGVYTTHRFLGPAVSMKALVAELKAGNYSARKSLRKNDELKDLMDELNSLAEELERKHGSGHP